MVEPVPPAASHVRVGGVALEVRHLAPPDGAPPRAPLVFLHEGLGCVSLWTQRGRDWPAELCAASGREGWLYSRRGYGRSEPIPDVRGRGRHAPDYLHREAWTALPALLAALGIRQPPVLVGHSDGASIALLYAARLPAAGCVAIAPHVVVEDVTLRAIAAARTAYEEGDLRARLARHHADPDSAFWQWNDVWLSQAFRGFDIRAECARIRAPLLLVQGLDDEYGTLAQLDAIQAAAPHAQRLELPHCGHSPQRDQPDALLAAVRDWLVTVP